MKILFGMHLDGAVWSNQSASVGEVRTGPLGLLSILETRLGVSRLSPHPVRRIDEYMKRMKELDKESVWFHKSFSVDPWSTARQLLDWRDELVEAGWHGKLLTTGSARLEALLALENVEIPLTAGRSDRLREVIEHLIQNIPAHIDFVELMEPLNMLPPVWQYLMNLLQSQGTSIQTKQEPEKIKPTTNLSRIQSLMRGETVSNSLTLQDDSLVLLKADNEWEAAEHLALWLASDLEANDQVTIICGMDTSVLDQALKRHGLPRIGRSEPSRWREIQQILPLMLANAWQPVDIRLLVELLSLSASPFPSWVCRFLLKAIAQEPGVGGRAWQQAMDEITKKCIQDLTDKGDSKAEEKAKVFVSEIQTLLVEDRYDPALGIPEEKLRERCQKVIEWLAWRINDNSVLIEVVSQAREIQKLSVGKNRIQQITLERMLDTVIGLGSTAEDALEEAALWHIVDHPGQTADPCGELVWWGFNDPKIAMPNYWSDREREALKVNGILLEESRDFRSRESHAWKQGLLHAENRFIAIHIAQIDGAEAYHHPYWDSIISAGMQTGNPMTEEDARTCLVRECNDFDHLKDWEFAGRKCNLDAIPKEIPTTTEPDHSVPVDVIKPPKRLSYSQMSTMLGCPMKWALQYHAGLRLTESQAVPTGNQMIGTFCHRIVEDLYTGGKCWRAEDAGTEAGQLYDSLLPSMASELLLEGNAIERLRYRSAIVEAVRKLVETINRLQLSVEKTEAPLEATIDGIPFIGYADLLLRDVDGHPFVLDLKWSSSAKYRRQEIEKGSALQLASYAWMLRSSEPSEQVHTGYFMLAQGQILSNSTQIVEDAIASPYTLEEIWDMGVAGLHDAMCQLEKGVVEAKGVRELQTQTEDGTTDADNTSKKFAEKALAEGMLYQRPPCQFCDFGRLCGLSEVGYE